MPNIDLLERRAITYSSHGQVNGDSGRTLLLVSQHPATTELLRSGLDSLRETYPLFGENDFRIVSHPDPDDSKIAGLVAEHKPAAIVLEPVIPEGEFTLARSIHSIREISDQPLIVVNGRVTDNIASNNSAVVVSLDAGADQFVGYPSSPLELAAKVVTTIRRAEMMNTDTILPAGIYSNEDMGIIFDTGNWEVNKKGVRVNLTQTEIRLLIALATEPGAYTTQLR